MESISMNEGLRSSRDSQICPMPTLCRQQPRGAHVSVRGLRPHLILQKIRILVWMYTYTDTHTHIRTRRKVCENSQLVDSCLSLSRWQTFLNVCVLEYSKKKGPRWRGKGMAPRSHANFFFSLPPTHTAPGGFAFWTMREISLLILLLAAIGFFRKKKWAPRGKYSRRKLGNDLFFFSS